jgi:hypothetical protein
MPPKIDVEGILAELKNLNDKVSSLVSIPAKLNKLESLITDLSNENKQLRKEIEGRDSTIYQLQNKLNHLEQHHRGWSIRVHNLQLQAGTESDPRKVMETVHAKLITPILSGALSKGAISTIPTASQILETAHPLPAKSGQVRLIIVRFRSRYKRDLMFQFKKDFAQREDTPGGVARGATSDSPGCCSPSTKTSRATPIRSCASWPETTEWRDAGQWAETSASRRPATPPLCSGSSPSMTPTTPS